MAGPGRGWSRSWSLMGPTEDACQATGGPGRPHTGREPPCDEVASFLVRERVCGWSPGLDQ